MVKVTLVPGGERKSTRRERGSHSRFCFNHCQQKSNSDLQAEDFAKIFFLHSTSLGDPPEWYIKGDPEDRESFRLEKRSVGREVEALGKSVWC